MALFPNDPSGGAPIRLDLASYQAASAAILSLAAALEFAVEAAVFLDRIEVDDKRARAEVLIEELLRKAKNQVTEPISEADELAGMTVALTIITEIGRRIQKRT